MKRIICYLVLLESLINTAKAQKYISITNPSHEKRLEIISISYPQFSRHFGVDTIFTIKEKSSGKVYTHQLEKLGLENPVNVLIQVNVPARGKIDLEVTKKKASHFPPKTYARFVPERFDDFVLMSTLLLLDILLPTTRRHCVTIRSDLFQSLGVYRQEDGENRKTSKDQPYF